MTYLSMDIKNSFPVKGSLSCYIEDESMKKIDAVLTFLSEKSIEYRAWYHPPAATIETAMQYWRDIPGTHCKNLFFRNHKGNRHYLVIFECSKNLRVEALEKTLKQGKLTFASRERMLRFLGVEPGSVSPFGLLNDKERHVTLFIDSSLKSSTYLSFHPNDNRVTIVILREDFFKFLESYGNEYQFFEI